MANEHYALCRERAFDASQAPSCPVVLLRGGCAYRLIVAVLKLDMRLESRYVPRQVKIWSGYEELPLAPSLHGGHRHGLIGVGHLAVAKNILRQRSMPEHRDLRGFLLRAFFSRYVHIGDPVTCLHAGRGELEKHHEAALPVRDKIAIVLPQIRGFSLFP